MKNILRIIVLSTLLIACTQDDTVLQQEETSINTKEETKESSMLSFDSQDEFKEFIAQKMESKENLLDEARIAFEERGRLSLLLVYNSLEKEEAEQLGLKRENIAKVDSPDSMLLFLLNENGEIGIEDKIFRIDGDFVYTYTRGFGKVINEFIAANAKGDVKIQDGETISFGENLTVFKHENKIEEITEKSAFTTKVIREFNGRKARMIAKQWNGHWAFYSSIGSVTKTQEWSKVLWWNDWKDVKTDNRLEFEASWYAQDFFEVSPRIKSKSSHNYCNCYEAIDVYDWSAGFIPAEFTPRSGVTKHWSHWYPATPNTVGTWIYY
ncbi:hypothetical protein SAMN04487910_1913 [Aquimarina amphilecti]|uniref:Uncharacterized protein n=1 Tax=Aquimarina amphilecti TaxID=1038014 RepID=A0A1H7MZN7_AQUAM|nr:hypothetical protein [Aquimarina amphilecti]SEL16654.1 hypothetical protein SAMN04487910_1913 [Aquimarina amphilecti]